MKSSQKGHLLDYQGITIAGTIYKVFNAFIRRLEAWAHTLRDMRDHIMIHSKLIDENKLVLKLLKLAHEKGAELITFNVHLKEDNEFDVTLHIRTFLTLCIG